MSVDQNIRQEGMMSLLLRDSDKILVMAEGRVVEYGKQIRLEHVIHASS